ncbi:MAG TPA: type II CAAX endopeptidase family protein [Candidatus Angelobacter sp.]|nr:type II CAAX endopeptidase family protein [Candidatus Angelobacter sp.]
MVLFVLLGASLGGARGMHPASSHGKLPQYLLNIAWEWALTGFVYLGIRKRITLRQLIGGRWNDMSDLLRDLLIAAAFWLVAIAVLGAGGHLLRLDEGGKFESMRRELGFLVPGTTLELIVWCLLSTTAGICEEIIFRGYLQRQFGAFTRSMLGGLILSAIVFGAAHGYEGGPRMLLIGVYGLMFGLLAWWRKSLRPGMIAHAWHDAFSGAVMRLLK